jgi:acetolactate synthase-1/2/3 large subunit
MKSLERARDLIMKAQRPILYVGAGALDAQDEVRALAKLCNIPVTSTLQGMGVFDEEDPLSLHMLGMHGSAYANFAMQRADLILAIGARFDDRVTGNLNLFAPEAKKASLNGTGGFIHFDIMPKNISKVVPADVAVVGDTKDSLKGLLPLLSTKTHPEWVEECQSKKISHPFEPYSRQVSKHTGKLRGPVVIQELNKQLSQRKEEVIITTGVGQHQMWAAQYIRWKHPRTFVTSGGLGTMGFGLPSAIGAKVAFPDKIVIDIDGDASFQMSAMELCTAVQFGINVKVLILNNDFQGMVKQWQDLFYDQRYSGTNMVNPDFVKFAEALNLKGLRASTPEELPAVIAEFLAHEGPVLMEAVCCKEEHVYPMVGAGKGLDEMVFGNEFNENPMNPA